MHDQAIYLHHAFVATGSLVVSNFFFVLSLAPVLLCC